MKLFYHFSLNYKGKHATYKTAPHLPFQGNKSIGRKKFIDIIKRKKDGENKIYVDLFGGSFYLSYLIHQIYPKTRIICNDFDNYMQRLCEIQSTQDLISKIREVFVEHSSTYSEVYHHRSRIPRTREEMQQIFPDIPLHSICYLKPILPSTGKPVQAIQPSQSSNRN